MRVKGWPLFPLHSGKENRAELHRGRPRPEPSPKAPGPAVTEADRTEALSGVVRPILSSASHPSPPSGNGTGNHFPKKKRNKSLGSSRLRFAPESQSYFRALWSPFGLSVRALSVQLQPRRGMAPSAGEETQITEKEAGCGNPPPFLRMSPLRPGTGLKELRLPSEAGRSFHGDGCCHSCIKASGSLVISVL